ncbi:LGFP repeat-containing protein [Nonomuraea fuscirosea]|uniref:LGFP repeat-containing protein n=1 Tax=Nonomuraea fuscirosea TaxID=1291556 RepID=UPI003432186E
MTKIRVLLAAATATAGLAILAPGAAQASTTSACDPALVAPRGSLIGDFWRSKGGANSVYGCPTTKEFGYPDKKGSWQRFRNSKIVWSPNLGNGTLVRAYFTRDRVSFAWSGLGRDWDYFNVLWDKNGNGNRQVRVIRQTPWSGGFSLPVDVHAPSLNGEEAMTCSAHGGCRTTFSFSVEGCDRGTFSSDCSPWSIPNSVTREG